MSIDIFLIYLYDLSVFFRSQKITLIFTIKLQRKTFIYRSFLPLLLPVIKSSPITISHLTLTTSINKSVFNLSIPPPPLPKTKPKNRKCKHSLLCFLD